MGRLVGVCSLVAALVVSLTGCASEARTMDAPGSAVREAHSATAGLVTAVRLLLDDRATSQLVQVSLDQTLDAVATAQQELVAATDADPQRRSEASEAVRAAVEVLVGFGDRGADKLDAGDLARLEEVERTLAAAAKDLRA